MLGEIYLLLLSDFHIQNNHTKNKTTGSCFPALKASYIALPRAATTVPKIANIIGNKKRFEYTIPAAQKIKTKARKACSILLSCIIPKKAGPASKAKIKNLKN